MYASLNIIQCIDVTPISQYQFLPDQIMDRFHFTAITPCFCCKSFEDFDLAQKCAKQDRMYRGEKITIE